MRPPGSDEDATGAPLTEDLPAGVEHVRTTPWFDELTRPDGLLHAHRIAAGVWGRLVVAAGSLDLVFEDDEERRPVRAGESAVIPPERPHHVVLDGPVRFAVEFHRLPGPTSPDPAA